MVTDSRHLGGTEHMGLIAIAPRGGPRQGADSLSDSVIQTLRKDAETALGTAVQQFSNFAPSFSPLEKNVYSLLRQGERYRGFTDRELCASHKDVRS